MKKDSGMYHPTGELQGDDKAMPDRGTGTGMNGDSYGADLSVDATNSQGTFNADSDRMDQLPQSDDMDEDDRPLVK